VSGPTLRAAPKSDLRNEPSPVNKPLRLRANDPKDLEVVSACLQDALVARRDMSFLDAERRFVMLVNRFRWETAPEEARTVPAEADGEVEPAEGNPFYPAEDYHQDYVERTGRACHAMRPISDLPE